MRKFISIVSILLVLSMLAGCDTDIQWFKEKKKVGLTALKDTELECDVFYVKQGTNFYEVFNNKEGALGTSSSSSNGKRVVPLVLDAVACTPSQYINEGIAYKTNDEILTSIELERFMSLGYSLGIYGGVFDDTGYICFDKRNLVKDSSLYNLLKKEKSDDIRIISINGEKITPNMVEQESGVIPNLEKGKTYTVQMYVGTTFIEEDLIADTLMLKSFEYYSYGNDLIDFTSNGYIVFETPNVLKSGYYIINGNGIFKYYDYVKGTKDDATTDMNESFYENERAMLEAQSRQYSIDVATKVKDLSIVVAYSSMEWTSDGSSDEDIRGYVYGPDGTQYTMKNDTENKTLTLNMTEALPGEWVVNITPKTVEILDVNVESTKAEEEATLKSEDIVFDQDETNVRFSCELKTSKEAEVFGYITSPDGRTYNMIYDYDLDGKSVIYYDAPFVLNGTWTVKIYYHPTLTQLGEIKTNINSETDTDVIIIGD